MKQLLSEIEFFLPEPVILLNDYLNMHWQARREYKKQLSWKVQLAVRGQKPKEPIQKCIVMIDRYSTKLPDWDGLYGGVKPLLDCLIPVSKRHPHGLNIIQDDSPKHIISLNCMPKLCKPGEEATRVVIMEVPDDTAHVCEKERISK